MKTGVLFVCLGNICRSPLAKVVFTDVVRRRGALDGFEIDSCGTGGWHAGSPADARTIAVAHRHGLDMAHRARQLECPGDFDRFGLLVAMDRDNRKALLGAGAPEPRVRLMRSFDPALRGGPLMDVPDPYYGGDDGFEAMYQMLVTACSGLYEHLAGPHAG